MRTEIMIKSLAAVIFATFSFCGAINSAEAATLAPEVQTVIDALVPVENAVAEGTLNVADPSSSAITGGALNLKLHGKELFKQDFADLADITVAEVRALLANITTNITAKGAAAPAINLKGKTPTQVQTILDQAINLEQVIDALNTKFRANLDHSMHKGLDGLIKTICLLTGKPIPQIP